MNAHYKTLSWHFWWRYVAINFSFWLLAFLMHAKLLKIVMLFSIFILPLLVLIPLMKRLSSLISMSYQEAVTKASYRKLAIAVYWRFMLMTFMIMPLLAGILKETPVYDYLSPIRLILSLPLAYLAIAWALHGAKQKGIITG